MTEIGVRLTTIVISCPIIHAITELSTCKKCPYYKKTIKHSHSNRVHRIICRFGEDRLKEKETKP